MTGRTSRPNRSPRTVVASIVMALVVVSSGLVGPGAGSVGAVSDGGANSRVVGRGDIITSIIGWRPPGSRSGPSGGPPPCRWWTLDDLELEWLVAVTGHLVAVGADHPLIDSLAAHLGAGTLPDGDLQAYSCGTDTLQLRFAPSTGPRDPHRRLLRQMITHLPAPTPRTSPPPDAAVPVNQPVFFSIPDEDWRPIEGTITADGISAQVRARPVSMRVISGDPAARSATCDGRGRLFDPLDPASPGVQSSASGVCSIRYRTATGAARSSRSRSSDDSAFVRPAAWLGTVTVLWEAEWRTDEGPWISLGPIPRTRLIGRPVTEVTTAIESD